MQKEVLLIADVSQEVFNLVWQEFNSRGFSVAVHRDIHSVATQFPVPGSFCGLLLIDATLLTQSIYEFCRSYKQQFAGALLIFLSDQVLPSVRNYALRQGAAELLVIPAPKDAERLVEKIEPMLQSHSLPRPYDQPSLEVISDPSSQLPAIFPLPTPNTNIPVKIALDGIHQLSRLATAHFSKYVVTNYWQVARSSLPEFALYLDLFAVEYNADIRFRSARIMLMPEEVLALRRWSNAFIERCQEAMEDFPLLLQEEDLLICAESFQDSAREGAAHAYIH